MVVVKKCASDSGTHRSGVDMFLTRVRVKAVRHGGTRMTWSWKVIPWRLRCFLYLPGSLFFFFVVLPLDENDLGAEAWTDSIAYRQHDI